MTGWKRLPAIACGMIAGLAALFAGSIPWSGIAGYPFLAGWNLRVFPTVPWAIAPMALYLWLYWKYLGGAGWPKSTSGARRMSLRANQLSGEVWPVALFAGFLGLAALLPLLSVMSRLATL